jgi:hypothetical protein
VYRLGSTCTAGSCTAAAPAGCGVEQAAGTAAPVAPPVAAADPPAETVDVPIEAGAESAVGMAGEKAQGEGAGAAPILPVGLLCFLMLILSLRGRGRDACVHEPRYVE